MRTWILRSGAFALPLAYAPVAFDAFVLPKLLLARILVVSLLSLEVARWALIRRVAITRTPIDLPLLAFVGSAALSTLLAVNRNVAVFGTYVRYEGLLTIATYALLFWVVSQALTSRAETKALIRTIIASAYLVSLLAVAQSLIGTSLTYGHAGETAVSFGGVIRATSTLGNANELAIFLAMVLPPCLHETVSARSASGRLIGVNATAVISIALLLTFSRSGWLGAAAGVLVVVASGMWSRRRALLVVVSTSALVVGVLIAVSRLVSSTLLSSWISRVASFAAPGGGSAGTRLDLWGDTIRLVVARPLAGSGPDTFGLVFPRYQTGNWTPGVPIDKAHSDVLQVAATQGLIGVATYAWLLATLFTAFWRGRRNEGASAMLGAVVAYLLAVQFNFSWIPAALPFWIFTAAAVATWCPSLPDSEPPHRKHELAWGTRLRMILIPTSALACAIGIGAGVAVTLRPLQADVAFLNALGAQHRGDIPAAAATIAEARSLAPWESAYEVRAGDIALNLQYGDTPGPGANPAAAASAYEDAARLGNGQPTAYRHLALAELALGHRALALSAAREAVQLGPFDPANEVLLQALEHAAA